MKFNRCASVPGGRPGARLRLVVSSGTEALSKMNDKITRVVINATVSPTAEFVRNPDWQLPGTRLEADIVEAAGAKNVDFVPAGKIARR